MATAGLTTLSAVLEEALTGQSGPTVTLERGTLQGLYDTLVNNQAWIARLSDAVAHDRHDADELSKEFLASVREEMAARLRADAADAEVARLREIISKHLRGTEE